MYPVTPPTTDLSRPGLSQIAHWIRDELDPVIARDGPEMLRPDDVLALHDIFLALKSATCITALDLRATSIHKAIMDISGIATRWPGRLADDCDKITEIWTAKFGRLEDLHPFLYGRGGRLEGIATANEYTKQGLTKRWQNTCPEKIGPKRSHRHGDLGFRPGSWWINPLFACHAGIIDMDSVGGGICFDKHGAYALLIRDTSEMEEASESVFTYRCNKNEKGKFRLTAATPKSRVSIRVLRSHNINSIWGPKAGVRYEGLYRVIGWTIHQMKSPDILTSEYRPGDTIYDIKFERDDPVPLAEVVKAPTSFEVDAYLEYKRQRKVHRELQRKGVHAHTGKPDALLSSVKVLPPTPTSDSQASQNRFPLKMRPITLRTATLKPPQTIEDLHTRSHLPPKRGVSTDVLNSLFGNEDLFGSSPKNANDAPAQTISEPTIQQYESGSSFGQPHSHPPELQAQTSSTSNSQTVRSYPSDMNEIAPWTDLEAQLTVPASNPPPVIHRKIIGSAGTGTAEGISDGSRIAGASSGRSPSLGTVRRTYQRERHQNKKPAILPVLTSHGHEPRKKDSRKSILVRSRNPMAKLFDGAEDNWRSYLHFRDKSRTRVESVSPRRAVPKGECFDRSDKLLSPIPIRPTSPASPCLLRCEDAMHSPYDNLESDRTSSPAHTKHLPPRRKLVDNSFTNSSRVRPTQSFPVSLHRIFTSKESSLALKQPGNIFSCGGESEKAERGLNSVSAENIRRSMENLNEPEVRISFRDPFQNPKSSPKLRRALSVSIPPDVIA